MDSDFYYKSVCIEIHFRPLCTRRPTKSNCDTVARVEVFMPQEAATRRGDERLHATVVRHSRSPEWILLTIHLQRYADGLTQMRLLVRMTSRGLQGTSITSDLP